MSHRGRIPVAAVKAQLLVSLAGYIGLSITGQQRLRQILIEAEAQPIRQAVVVDEQEALFLAALRRAGGLFCGDSAVTIACVLLASVALEEKGTMLIAFSIEKSCNCTVSHTHAQQYRHTIQSVSTSDMHGNSLYAPVVHLLEQYGTRRPAATTAANTAAVVTPWEIQVMYTPV